MRPDAACGGRAANEAAGLRAARPQTEGAHRPLSPVGYVAPGLQAHSAPTWLTQGIPLEDNEAVGVGHQQVEPEAEARPAPAVLQAENKPQVTYLHLYVYTHICSAVPLMSNINNSFVSVRLSSFSFTAAAIPWSAGCFNRVLLILNIKYSLLYF